jgi:hypothetical protein
MKYWLMLILCLPGKPVCDVKFSGAVYPKAEWCVTGADAHLYFQTTPYLMGVFCEKAKTQPKPYHIRRDDLP